MDSLTRQLCSIPIGSVCIVEDVEADETQKLRLFDLGFFLGSHVCPLYECYGGKTRVYSVKRTLIAIRSTEASCILAKEVKNGK